MRQEDLYKNHRSQGETQEVEQHQPPHCANCDIDILWSPIVVRGVTFCCAGCAAGGPCCCDYSQYRSVTISGVIHYGPDQEASKPSYRENS